MGIGCMALFFLSFVAIGLALFWMMGLRSWLQLYDARSWEQVPCTVLESHVDEIADSDGGSTYKPVVFFAYRHGGQDYRSNRYNFQDFYSSGYEAKAEVVARYPPGKRTVCYVNPDKPFEAVLIRDFSAGYLVGLVPLIFVAAGLGGLLFFLKTEVKGRRPSRPREPAPIPAAAAQADPLAPRELRSSMSPGKAFFGLLFITLFWNGIVSVFIWQMYKGWKEGSPDGCLTLFLVPFELIGLLLVYGTLRQILVLFNPRPRLTLNPGTLAPGESIWLQWRLAGGTGGVRRLEILLEGVEEAQYRRGTDNVTDRETFASIPIVDTTDDYSMGSGSTAFSVPPDAVPSFTAGHNKILWKIKTRLEIANWPDSEEEFEVAVVPGVTRLRVKI